MNNEAMSTSLRGREYGRNRMVLATHLAQHLAYIVAASATVNCMIIVIEDGAIVDNDVDDNCVAIAAAAAATAEALLTGEQGGPSGSQVNQKW